MDSSWKKAGLNGIRSKGANLFLKKYGLRFYVKMFKISMKNHLYCAIDNQAAAPYDLY